jgi:hypothetical protein
MYNPNQRKIMVVSGEAGKKIYEQSQKPVRNTTLAAQKARESLRKKGLNI